MAWESLVETHVAHALGFITLLRGHLTYTDSLDRYLTEMQLAESMRTAVRTRVLVNLEERLAHADEEPARSLHGDASVMAKEPESWERFLPDIVVRGVRRQQRRSGKVEGWIELALARAEEAVITTHVDNAITFAALLQEHGPLAEAVQHYIEAVALSGSRAQAVHQRTMARLAEVHLPRLT